MTAPKPTLRRKIHGIMFRLPGMISCSEFEDFVLAYLEGELPRTQRLLFELHLKVCRECRQYLEAYRLTLKTTQKISRTELNNLADVPDDLIAAILDAKK